MTERIGIYEIIRLLAHGGMATVYLVRQPALDREVVLKRLDLESEDPRVVQRFVGEARLAATLDHPNVVTLFDFFEHDGVPYIAMEYVAGGSLRALVGRLTLPQIVGVVEGLLAGLGHAEAHGIAHRDLKPENVLLTPRGSVKIADFGIARAYNALTDRLTTTGMAIGTPAYMAPEQALNEQLGPYTDLYAIGIIVYELLAGRPPFDSDTPVGLLYCQVHKTPPTLDALLPQPQPALCEWVAWLLSKAPADRPQSAAEAWHALEESTVAELGPYWRRMAAIAPPPEPSTAVEAPVEATTARQLLPTTPAPLPVRSRRRRAVMAGVSLGALAAVAGALAGAGEPADPGGSAAKTSPQPSRPAKAVPYDFDRDGRQELVAAILRASPRGSRTKSGVVLVRRPGTRSRWSVITENSAGVGGRPHAGDDFGSGLSSGDFDGDGWADLAIGTPGRDHVSVLYGGAGGVGAGLSDQLTAADAQMPPGAGEYGYSVLARDFNGDDVSDLLVSAPGERPGQPGTGALALAFGDADKGLGTDGQRVLLADPRTLAGFGTRTRSGDLDRDHRTDIVEGAPTMPTAAGHLSYCRGAARGPRHCRAIPGGGGTSGLAVADVNGDGYDDIIQGDSGRLVLGSAGEVRVWRGSRHGPRSIPLVIDQDTPSVPGHSEPGDQFGAVVEAGDYDGDGFADIFVGAVGENGGAGSITVIRGGRSGHASTGHGWFDQDESGVPGSAQPGREFGATLTMLRPGRDKRADLVVAARGADTADERIMVVRGGSGAFAPDETTTTTVSGIADAVHAPRGGRIRLARSPGA